MEDPTEAPEDAPPALLIVVGPFGFCLPLTSFACLVVAFVFGGRPSWEALERGLGILDLISKCLLSNVARQNEISLVSNNDSPFTSRLLYQLLLYLRACFGNWFLIFY